MGENFMGDIPGDHEQVQTTEEVLLGDATEEQTIFVAPFACVITGVAITADADAAGDNTNRKNLNVIDKGADGNGTTEIANLDLTLAVDLDANDERAIPLSVTTNVLAEGEALTLEIEQVGTGVTIPRSLVRTSYRAQ